MLISAQEPTLNPELIADALRQRSPSLRRILQNLHGWRYTTKSWKFFR